MARLLEHPRAPRIVLLLAALLALPSIGIGFYTDDHALVAYLEHRFAPSPPWFDLYRFIPGGEATRALIAGGGVPWWSAPGLRIHLIRPLPSALFTLDHALFGHAPLGYHLHSIAWYVALVAAVAALYRRVLPGGTGALALFVFALADAAYNSFGWISARHLLIAALAVTLALIAQLRAEEGWRTGRWAAPLAIALGLLGGEAALGGVAYLVAYALAGPAPSHGAASRVRRAAPALAIAIAYLVAYRAMGGGAADSAMYVEPFGSPGAYALATAVRLPVLVGNAVLGLPAELLNVVPAATLAGIGLAAGAMIAILYRLTMAIVPDGERATVRWLALGALLSLVPSLGGSPGSRMLLVPNLGFAALFAVLLRHGFRRIEGQARLALVARRAMAGLLAAVHVALAPVALLGNTRMIAEMARKTEAIAHSAPLDGPRTQRAVIVAASDPLVFLYPVAVLDGEGEPPASCWSLLSGVHASHRLTRLAADRIALEPIGTTFLRGPFETLYRAPSIPLSLGDEVVQCGATVRVAAVEDGRPSRIEVRFDASIGDPSRLFLAWNGERLERFVMPPIGESVELAWHAGPTGVF